MKISKSFKKIVVVLSIFALVINFSLVNAAETSVTIEDSGSPVAEIQAPAAEPAAPINPELSQPEAVAEETPNDSPESVVIEEPSVPASDSTEIIPGQEAPATETPLETEQQVLGERINADEAVPEPIIMPEPAVFDLAEPQTSPTALPAETVTPSPTIYSIPTGIIRNTEIKELTILAQWQMLDEIADNQYTGADDSTEKNAQFLPSGQFEISKPIAICALVADAGGTAEINEVAAEIYYPETVAKSLNSVGDASASSTAVRVGCGGLYSQLLLAKQSVETVSALVCGRLRNNNNNLPAWGSDKTENLVYSYDHLCGQDGLLAKQQADLYCGEASLAYDSPAGDYKVKISAQNLSGETVIGENDLRYLEITTFENDFSDIQYGLIKAGVLKTLNGDEIFDTATAPTIRNTGNTRLQIKITQNDFNLGKTDGVWNLEYRAKIGDQANFLTYEPEQTTALSNLVELGQSVRSDFSILVKKFPPDDGKNNYAGSMTLSADKAPALGCE